MVIDEEFLCETNWMHAMVLTSVISNSNTVNNKAGQLSIRHAKQNSLTAALM
jgi:hypothetical protein